MPKILKLNHTPDSKIFFWGCTHVFHDKEFIWRARGYNSIMEHAEAIREKINSTCRPQDILIHLGDGFLTCQADDAKNFIFSLKPHICYIWGNHESQMGRFYQNCIKEYQALIDIGGSDNVEVYPFTKNNITFWGHYKPLWINKKFCVLQHFPLQVFDYQKHGAYHIHSHEHGKLASSLPEHKKGLVLDVGVDVFPNGPVSFEEIQEIMKNKEIVSVDNHH